MNLRFTPTALALALYISSAEGSRRTVGALLGSELADNSSPYSYRINGGGNNDENTVISRQHADSISASVFEHGIATSGQRLYYPDVGILQAGKSRRRLMNDRVRDTDSVQNVEIATRFLQAKETPMCGTNGTCLPSACTCRANGGVISDQCAPIFNSLCNGYTDANGKNWTMEGCWDLAEYPGLQKYAIGAYCDMSKCIADGGSSGSCYCQLYHSLCQTYGNERPYNVSVELRSIIDFLLSNSTHLNGFCDRSLCAAHFTTRLMRARQMLSKQDG